LPEDLYNKEANKLRVKKSITMQDVKENFRHISYNEKLVKSMSDLYNTDPEKVIKR
jgi:hypothetical protein